MDRRVSARTDPRRPAARRYGSPDDREGRSSGSPLRITPVRLVVFVALIGSLAYLAFALTVRDASQIPMLASGAIVLGIVFLALAAFGFVATRRAGWDGRTGQAFALAFFGGGAAIVGFVAIAMGIVLAMLWGRS